MASYVMNVGALHPEIRDFYYRVISALQAARLPFLVGGAYALGSYTGVVRDTKDFDVFVRPEDARRTLDALARAGYRTELTDAIWLGKAFHEAYLVDVIFGLANGLATVDATWFGHARGGRFLDLAVRLVPPEEMVWSKSFVMTRDRYDGADIAHLLLGYADGFDWARLLRRFGDHWRVLYNHLLLFGYIYPFARERVPLWLLDELARRLAEEIRTPPPAERLCRGTLFSTTQYVIDIEQWGCRDARPAAKERAPGEGGG
jgi:hypothetical protein